MGTSKTPQGPWVRSSFCVADNDCVEISRAAEAVFVRDSKDPIGHTLRFSWPEWLAFVAGVKSGEFD
jgi:hypothetical protein